MTNRAFWSLLEPLKMAKRGWSPLRVVLVKVNFFWSQLLLDLKGRDLKIGPQLAVGEGALGFWEALTKVYGNTRRQRCWVHKTANVLNKLPKSLQAKAKTKLHPIWMAAEKDDA